MDTTFQTFAERIDPRRYGFSPFMALMVGAIIGYDYGVRDSRGGHISHLSITSDGCVVGTSTMSDGGGAFLAAASNLERNLDRWKEQLRAEDVAEFEKCYVRVDDWRTLR